MPGPSGGLVGPVRLCIIATTPEAMGPIVDTEWLKDFLMLSSTLNFSRAAAMRNLTQPTFSRRIRQLEQWLGGPLVDRTVFPVALTREGVEFRRAAEEIVQALYRERDLARGVSHPKRAFVSLAMVQTIATSFFPFWIAQVEQSLGPLRTSVQSGSIYDCFEALASQACDIVLSYNSRAGAVPTTGYVSIKVAEEQLMPVSTPDEVGRSVFDLDAASKRPIPYLGFSGHAYLAGLVRNIIEAQPSPPSLDLCFESALAASLKAMALAGRGIAWLPYHSVKEEIETGRLVAAGSARWMLPLEIRAYRASDDEGRDQVKRLWASIAGSEPLRCHAPSAQDEEPARHSDTSDRNIRLRRRRAVK